MSDDVKQRVSETDPASAEEETPLTEETQEEPRSREQSEASDEFTAEQRAELEASLQAALEEQDRLASMYRRLRADFDNYKRRSSEETERLKKSATFDFILELLPVVDNLERAEGAASESEGPLAEGVRLVLRQLHQVLEEAGVQVIPTVGEPFNPQYHEAVGQVPAEDGVEEGTIVDEVLKGYRMGDRVLRPSMVRVAG